MMHSRRQRYRAEMIDEAKRIACDQLAEFGASGVSVNAIARRMGVTGPALYRYFTNRDELLTALIRDAYTDLAKTVEEVAGSRRAAAVRLRDMAAALHEWAVREPHRYLLLFGTPVPGYAAPQDTIDIANRLFVVFARTVAQLGESGDAMPRYAPQSAVERQLARLAPHRELGDVPVRALRLAVIGLTRLHGVISLAVEGQFTPMGIDGKLLVREEIDSIIAEATA